MRIGHKRNDPLEIIRLAAGDGHDSSFCFILQFESDTGYQLDSHLADMNSINAIHLITIKRPAANCFTRSAVLSDLSGEPELSMLGPYFYS